MLLALQEELGLSEQQVESINAIRSDYAKTRIEMDSKIRLQRLEMEELLNEDNINRKKIETVLSRLGTLKTQSEISFVHHLLDLREILTPEQVAKLETIKLERRRQYWDKRTPRPRNERGRF